MSTRKFILLAVGVLGAVWGLLQLYTLLTLPENPPIVRQPSWDSPETRALVERACYDCHSNETVWPWYSKIAPLSFVIRQDVRNGREVLNYSEWGVGEPDEGLHSMIDTISKEQMPLPYYAIIQADARLTRDQRSRLIDGLIESLE